MQSAYCFGTSSAPVVAGALVQNGQWRWYFCTFPAHATNTVAYFNFADMNLPICAVTGLLVATCLDLKVPHGTIKEKLLKLDWMCVVSVLLNYPSDSGGLKG